VGTQMRYLRDWAELAESTEWIYVKLNDAYERRRPFMGFGLAVRRTHRRLDSRSSMAAVAPSAQTSFNEVNAAHVDGR
jgi:hypothetical protein